MGKFVYNNHKIKAEYITDLCHLEEPYAPDISACLYIFSRPMGYNW
jgi:hypothetical protein